MVGSANIVLMTLLLGGMEAASVHDDLAREFAMPPAEARPWVFWWWLNGNASKEGITRDFEEMKKKGIGGAVLFDAGEAGAEVPRGPAFMSDGWRELFRHAVKEADRNGIVLTVNLCSGWNCGGPWVTPDHAIKKLVAAQTSVKGPGKVSVTLSRGKVERNYYHDVVVLAAPAREKTWNSAKAVDLTRFMDANGQLKWEAPVGDWKVLRIGATLTGRNTANPGSGPGGLEIDPMDAEAMDVHFAQTGAKLIADAGPLAGRTLQYFHIDSWEIGQPTWTSRMRQEFQNRRGYDPLSWLPAVVGQMVDGPEQTQRFMQDFRRTVADLVVENYYGRLNELSVKGGLRGAHSEAGGPIGAHHFWGDALKSLGVNAVPMGEFWTRNWEPNGSIFYGPHNHTIKEIASAAHTYGKPVCQAEAFTSLAEDFTESPWSMKDIGDAAFCDGLTRMVFHNWPTHSKPKLKPGYWWVHIGTHFGYNVTWWPMAEGWLTYLARCQHMLKQGQFVADFAYLQSEGVPSFCARTCDQKPMRPAGFDYDAIHAEVIQKKATAKDGRLVLPDGISYRYLVLPHEAHAVLSPQTIKKVNELAAAGVKVISPKDELAAIVRADGIEADIEFRNATKGAEFDWIHRRTRDVEIYFVCNQGTGEATANVIFRVNGKQPELWDPVTGAIRDLTEWRAEGSRTAVPMRFAERQSFFVIFRKTTAPNVGRNFPEMKAICEINGPWSLRFDPQWFYPKDGLSRKVANGMMTFEQLEDWSLRPEPAIRHFSGTVVYRKTFDAPLKTSRLTSSGVLGEGPRRRVYLDLGTVKVMARVRLNGRDLGVVWTSPWRVEIIEALKEKGNELEIEVVNLWPNRLIGDAHLPKDQRRTVSNILTYDAMLQKFKIGGSSWAQRECPTCKDRLESGKPPKLISSGLLGPVRIMENPE